MDDANFVLESLIVKSREVRTAHEGFASSCRLTNL